MAQTNKLTVANLDFDEIKSNLKDFLRSQKQFQDYDFEGSSMAILLDLLAYNTHYNGFYANMIANEMFLDTAILRESVVSRAKMIGYTPSSRSCSEAYVDIISKIKRVDALDSAPSTVTLNAFSKLSSAVGDTAYTFLTDEAHIMGRYPEGDTDDTWAYIKKSIKIKEGKYQEYQYTVSEKTVWGNEEFTTDHYIIPSNSADINTVIVNVQNSIYDSQTAAFIYAGDIQSINGNDPVYWLHEIEDNKYEIKFGDGRNVGKKVDDGNIIKIKYISTHGADANGCKKFLPSSLVYSGWPSTIEAIADSTTVTVSSYRVLELDQTYASNFIIGETVVGKTSEASGVVSAWDDTENKLRLISTNGVFLINETVVGWASGTQAAVALSSLEESKSSNGSERESTESIRTLAPRSFQAQNRCVTKEDFEAILNKFYLNIRSIKVWGGETMVPPQYGKVFIAIRPHTGQFLTNYEKSYIKNEILAGKKIMTVLPEIVDPEYIYIVPTVNVKYNPHLIIGNDLVIDNVINSVRNYASTNLNDFTAPFYISKLNADIVSSDESITSTIVSMKLKRYFEPIFNISTSQIIKFSNRIKTDVIGDYRVYNDIITSSEFTFNGVENCKFSVDTTNISLLCVIDGNGDIVTGGENVGYVDFQYGTVEIKNFITSETDLSSERYSDLKGRIAIYVEPYEYDIFAKENQIIDILNSDISVTRTDIRTLVQ